MLAGREPDPADCQAMEPFTPVCANGPARTQTIGFVLLDNFTLISLASAMEPLRMANQLSGQELYHWLTLTFDGRSTYASDTLRFIPDSGFDTAPELDMVIVCGGVNVQNSIRREHIAWLQARRHACLGAVCTGSWALAQAGLLDGYECSVHWEYLSAMQEAFPQALVNTRLFSIDRNRCTTSGGAAPLDMMLALIGQTHGHALVAGISEMFVCDRVRNAQDHQRVPIRHMLGSQQPKLQEIVALMEANLEEPIMLDDLAGYVGISRRQLERLFQKYLNCSPSRYYMKLRLMRARQLLKQTPMSILEVAMICGFVSTAHFSKCYRDYFTIAPRDDRAVPAAYPESTTALKKAVLPATSGNKLRQSWLPTHSRTALTHAEGEPGFASVKL